MQSRITEAYNLRGGAVVSTELGYLLAGDDEVDEDETPHTVVLTWKPDGWYAQFLGWTASASCILREDGSDLLIVGRGGEFAVCARSGVIEGQIANDVAIRAVRRISGRIYAAGISGAVFCRTLTGHWKSISRSLPPDVDLEAIDGFAPNELYGAGWNGALVRFDGHRWHRIETPTNLILTSVLCADDGQVYCAGRHGMLLRGRGDEWEVLLSEATVEDIWDLAWFGGKLFMSTSLFLYNLTPQGLALVHFDGAPPNTCLRLSTAESSLWSIGTRDCLMFDGLSWNRIA